MNITFPQDDITSESFVVQWDEVNDIFPVNYTVRWYGEDGSNGTANVTGLSYTVTGLTNNISYNVTVVAINTCCGTGPVSNVTMVMTNMKPTTLPPSSPTSNTTATPTGNVCYYYAHIHYCFDSTLYFIHTYVRTYLTAHAT